MSKNKGLGALTDIFCRAARMKPPVGCPGCLAAGAEREPPRVRNRIEGRPIREREIMNDHFDVIIIGSGAGGGTLAYRLAPSGRRILLVERGDYARREPENWSSKAVFGNARYKTKEEWICKDGTSFHPGQHYYVGGQTKFYGAILFRMRERDFGEVRHHDGVSPAWPISYND